MQKIKRQYMESVNNLDTIKTILEDIFQTSESLILSDEQKCDFLERFWLYYRENQRHLYHEVTLFLVKKADLLEAADNTNFDVFSEAVLSMVEFAKNVQTYCSGKNKKECDDYNQNTCRARRGKCYYSRLEKPLTKLYDHIQLEIVRINEIQKANSKLKKELNDADKRLEVFEEKAQELNEKLSRAEKKAKNAQKESITILSIFAAIVLAFLGNMAFSTSVLQNLDQSSIFRISMALVLISLTFINIIYLLVWFIMKLHEGFEKEIKYPAFMIVIDIVLFVLLVVVFIICTWNPSWISLI